MGPDRQGLRAVVRAYVTVEPTTSWPPSTRRPCARSTSRSSSTSSAIDPIFYDSAYYLAPDKASKPYALLARAMEDAGQGRHRPLRDAHQAVPRGHPPERRAAAAVDDGLRRRGQRPVVDRRARRGRRGRRSPTRSWPWPRSSSSRSPADFEPDRFKDTYREAVLDLIEKKAAGEEIVAPVSQIQPRQGRRPHGGAGGLGGRGQGGPQAPSDRARPRGRGVDEAGDAEATNGGPRRRRRRRRPAKKSPAKKATARRKSA